MVGRMDVDGRRTRREWEEDWGAMVGGMEVDGRRTGREWEEDWFTQIQNAVQVKSD